MLCTASKTTNDRFTIDGSETDDVTLIAKQFYYYFANRQKDLAINLNDSL